MSSVINEHTPQNIWTRWDLRIMIGEDITTLTRNNTIALTFSAG